MAMSDDVEEIWKSLESGISRKEVRRAVANARDDQVVCRECARALGQITAQHLATHGMELREYRAAHPDSPIYPNAEGRQPGRDPGFTHSEATKQAIGESAKRNHEQGRYE
jgi:hypothetical protein